MLLSIITSTQVHKGIVYISGIRLNSASYSSQGRQSCLLPAPRGGVTGLGVCLLSTKCTVGKGFVPGIKEGCPVC